MGMHRFQICIVLVIVICWVFFMLILVYLQYGQVSLDYPEFIATG